MEWLSPLEAFAFETHGFVVLEGVVSARDLAEMNAWLDANPERAHTRSPEQMLDGRANAYHTFTDPSDERYTGSVPAPRLTGSEGRKDFGGFFSPDSWSDPSTRAFRDLIANPALVRWMLATIGDEFRWDSGGGIIQPQGSEGFVLHGRGAYRRPSGSKGSSRAPSSWYRLEGGRFTNGLMACNIALTDVGPGDGGFCCIPGSHKAQLRPPLSVRRLDTDIGMVTQIPMKAGSVCIFTEALTHGTLPWCNAAERRCLIYRYNPAFLVGGPGTTQAQADALAQIPEQYLTPLQRALMEPAWVGGAPPGEEGGRPDIGALCAALPGGLPDGDDEEEAESGAVALYTIGRL